MTANKTPIFGELPLLWSAALTSQTLTRDGVTGGGVLLGTIGSDGGIIDAILCQPLGDISANVVRIFGQQQGLSPNLLLLETTIAAVASSTNAAAIARTAFILPEILTPTGSFGLRLPPGFKLYAALGTASGTAMRVNAIGMQYSTI